jgi:hypothetical protein
MAGRRAKVLWLVVAVTAVIVGAAPTFLIALRNVLAGRGGDAYLNAFGLAIHFTSVLTSYAALVVTLIVVLFFRLRDYLIARNMVAQIDRKIALRSHKP